MITQDPLALHAMEMIQANLVKSYNGDMAARDSMHNAQCLAGMAFSNVGLGVVHGMAHPLGAIFDIPHGVANALLLPVIMGVQCSGCFAQICRYRQGDECVQGWHEPGRGCEGCC